MSNPVTTAEVEDVLSSIRRLVSEEKRPTPSGKPGAMTDRLVLTPALRVDPEPMPAQDGDDALARDIHAAFQAERDRAAKEAKAAGQTQNLQIEAKASDWTPQEVTSVNLSGEPVGAAADAQAVDDLPAVDDVQAVDGDPFDHSSDDPVETTATAAKAPDDLAQQQATDHIEFRLQMKAPEPVPAPEPEASTVVTPLILHQNPPQDADWKADALAEAEAVAEGVTTAQDPSIAETKAATLSAKIEALESAIGGIEDDFEPDEVSDDDYSGTEPPALQWEDDLQGATGPETVREIIREDFATDLSHDMAPDSEEGMQHSTLREVTPDLEAAIAEDTMSHLQDPIQETVFEAAAVAAAADARRAEDVALGFAQEEKLLDEDALRDMVGEIVRSELQGALGERITRNVRKLVRREIHRALTTQDLD